MALYENCREYVGRLLWIFPVYGWGWWEFGADGFVLYTQEQSAGPPPFPLRVEYFYSYAGVLQGAVGQVEAKEHPFDGFYAAFYLRDIHQKQPTDFTNNPGHYNIQLGPDRPYPGEHPPGEDNDWPVWIFTGRPYIGGYASIGDRRMHDMMLENCFNDLAVIRTTFETLDLFPADDPIRAEMFEMILEARENLVRRFGALCFVLQDNQITTQMTDEKFKAFMLQLMTSGYPGHKLDIDALEQMDAPAFAITLVNDLLDTFQNAANYADQQTFDVNVFKKYLAFLFCIYACTDPMFYGL